jgi:hypothetical protein
MRRREVIQRDLFMVSMNALINARIQQAGLLFGWPAV